MAVASRATVSAARARKTPAADESARIQNRLGSRRCDPDEQSGASSMYQGIWLTTVYPVGMGE